MMAESEAAKYSKCLRCNEYIHSSLIAHHLFAIHQQYAETTNYVNPFVQDNNSECPICKCICMRFTLRDHLADIHQFYILRTGRIEVPSTKTTETSLFDEFFPDRDEFCLSIVKCPTCSKEIRAIKFVEHYHNEHGIKCIKCNVGFATQQQKNHHILIAHRFNDKIISVKRERKRKRTKSNKDFKTSEQEDDRTHKVQKTTQIKINRKQTRPKSYMCYYCGNYFESLLKVQQHIDATHKKIRSYLCDICGRSFLRYTHLRNHRRTHFDIRPYQCKICLKRSRTGCLIKKHLKKHHNIITKKCRWNDPLLDKDSIQWRKLSEDEEKFIREAEQKEMEDKNGQREDDNEENSEDEEEEVNEYIFNF